MFFGTQVDYFKPHINKKNKKKWGSYHIVPTIIGTSGFEKKWKLPNIGKS
jgi:hypothetical protein